jgi:hypothetical protein
MTPGNVTPEQFDKLTEFDTASWAIWSPTFNQRDCLESDPKKIKSFLRSQMPQLKRNIILLGLNRSLNEKKAPPRPTTTYPRLANFHTSSHAGDRLLNTVTSRLPNIKGAFMTDLSVQQESKSRKIQIDPSKALDNLVGQLDILDSPSFHIVCFGGKVFKTFSDLSGISSKLPPSTEDVNGVSLTHLGMILNCYKVIHYSYAVRYHHQDRFMHQMKVVNRFIGAHNNG